MKTINYKGKGEHSVNELELIINQQAEELHLFNSGQKQLNLSGVIVPKDTLCCPECNSTNLKNAIHTDYKECNKCCHYWEHNAQ